MTSGKKGITKQRVTVTINKTMMNKVNILKERGIEINISELTEKALIEVINNNLREHETKW